MESRTHLKTVKITLNIFAVYRGQNRKLAIQNCMHFNQLCAKSFNLIFKVSLEHRQRSNQRRDEGAADDCPVSSFSEPRKFTFFLSYDHMN